ncbi:lectin domain containing protein [Pelagibacter phage HTVC201P]|nr:lectin domain containing protein [Pelagibacter phage HTVC201P]
MANTTLTKTFASTGNRKTWTFSAWVKRTSLSANVIFSSGLDTNYFSNIEIDNNNRKFQFFNYQNATTINLITTRLFRDTNAWYHIVLAVDSTQATASDRVKLYVNGVQETAFDTAIYPTQNTENVWNAQGYTYRIGVNSDNNGRYFDGLMSHIHMCDGTQYQASDFGEYDANGVWKIKTSPSVTYGTNGFFILKDGNSVTDQSGNGNNWSVSGGTLTKTEDNPSNVFCTMNPLQLPFATGTTFSLGNTKVAGNNADWQRVYGTIGAKTGKWFYEFKNLQNTGFTGECRIGWDSIDFINDGTDNYYSGLTIDRAGKLRGGINGVSGYSPNEVQMTAAYSGGNFSFTNGDILGMAIDLDNETFSVYKNGNLEIDAYSYAGLSNNSISKSRGYFIAPSYNWYSSSSDNNRSCFNFGNGYFETTAVTSAGTNASGIGIFEYDVPTNHTAWSTKGLNL